MTRTSKWNGGTLEDPRPGRLVAHVDPLILAVVAELPPAGQPLPAKRRALFMQALEQSIILVYPEEAHETPGGADELHP